MVKLDSKKFNLAVCEMKRIAERLNVPQNIIEEAITLFRSLCEEGMVRFVREVYFSTDIAALYYTLKRNHFVVPFRRFCKAVSVRERYLLRTYRNIVSIKGIPPQPSPIAMIKEIGEKMGLGKNTIARAIELYDEIVKERAFSSKSPFVLAAACLYYANIEFEEGITKKRIAEEFGIATASIVNVLRKSFFNKERSKFVC